MKFELDRSQTRLAFACIMQVVNEALDSPGFWVISSMPGDPQSLRKGAVSALELAASMGIALGELDEDSVKTLFHSLELRYKAYGVTCDDFKDIYRRLFGVEQYTDENSNHDVLDPDKLAQVRKLLKGFTI